MWMALKQMHCNECLCSLLLLKSLPGKELLKTAEDG